MRNLDTPVKQIRRKIFTEIAKIGFESTDESLIHDIESIPYNIVEERAKYRESIYRERAVASERVRLAMGLSLRPENRSVHLTDGVKASNIDEKYYEPPLMQVIPSACSACESNKYEVSNMCRGCVAHPCMLTCPKGAISMVDGKSFIDQDKCIHCGNCIEFTNGKGCLAAKSLSVTGGENGMDLKGMNRYQHFGLRQEFLEHFFEYKTDCFSMRILGTRQYDALKIWLKEAELIYPSNKGKNSGAPTELFAKLEQLGPYNPLTWAIIWTNLAYNSIICKWYMLYTTPGEVYEKGDLIFMLGDDYSQSTRDNAVTALFETFRFSPIGNVLKQGIPIAMGNSYKYARQGWESADAIAILYSLYKWAEATGNYTFSLRQMIAARGKDNVVGVDPGAVFGIADDILKEILQSIALQMEKYLRVSFVMNLDNVILSKDVSSLDIIDLAL